MVLSNAERQARFQKRLREKAAAARADLGDRVREVMDEAIALLWSIVKRPGTDGLMDADADTFADLEAYRTHWAQQLRAGEDAARWFDVYLDEATADERPVLERAIAVVKAARLSHIAIPSPAKPKRRGK